jgi:hypothetical protein
MADMAVLLVRRIERARWNCTEATPSKEDRQDPPSRIAMTNQIIPRSPNGDEAIFPVLLA